MPAAPTGADAKALARLEAQRRKSDAAGINIETVSAKATGEVLAGFGRGTTGGNTSSKLEHSASLYSQGAASRSAITGVAPSVVGMTPTSAGAVGGVCGGAARTAASAPARPAAPPPKVVLNASAARNGGPRAAAATKVERAAAAKAAKAAVAESIATRSPTASSVPGSSLFSGRDPQVGVADVAQLLSLSEEAVMQNTMVRFARDEIYSWVGSLLLAVNPYKQIARLYGEEAMRPFEGQRLLNARPHVYAIAEEACRKARRGGGSQSLIISGESGAGKTESTKFALSYIVWRSRDGANGALTQRILQANPLLESLGNAKTVRNHNSSRFGKCVRLCTDPTSGALLGAYFHTYLLEKSRVVQFGAQERNFHIFYQLLAVVAPTKKRPASRPAWRWRAPAAADGAGAASAAPAPPAELGLGDLKLGGASPAEFALLSSSGAQTSEGIDDVLGWADTAAALTSMGFTPDEQRALFAMLAALLHLSNLAYDDDAKGAAKTTPGCASALGAAAHVLGASNLETLLTVREMAVKDEVMRIELRADQAAHARDGLLKSLYGLAFGWVVAKINTAMRRDGGGAAYVGGEGDVYVDALDIFGFENFGVNSFEQLCINFANEKLHQLFLYAMFKAEHEARNSAQFCPQFCPQFCAIILNPHLPRHAGVDRRAAPLALPRARAP